VPPNNTENVLRYELSLIIGITVTVAVGLSIHFKSKRKTLK
jgi:hypothetical protein